MIEAGKLRHRVRAERTVEATDGAGGVVTTWVPLAAFWAQVETVGGREALRSGQILADTQARINTHWSPTTASMTANDRLIYNNTIYSIVSPPADLTGNKEWIQFVCSAGLNDG